MNPNEKIYHIALASAWENALENGQYDGGTLETEGFIHFSRREQLIPTANRYYVGNKDLLLLIVSVEKLAAKLIIEPSPGCELFPHLYGALNLDAVEKVVEFPPDPDGKFTTMPD